MIVLVIGHTPKKPGAVNERLGVTEYELNEIEAKEVSKFLTDAGIDNVVVYRETYKDLPAKINAHNPDLIVSFHHNSFSETSTGTETLYYHKSKAGKKFAEELHKSIVDTLGYKDRELKPKTSEDRGGYLLRYTKAPCVILEPCFMSNTEELKDFIKNQDKYCKAVVRAIEDFMS